MSRLLIDFDGTLCPGPYTTRFECNGKPTPEAVQFIEDALAAGFECIIFTARLSDATTLERNRMHDAILAWCRAHFDDWSPLITAEKHPGIIIDDNAYRFKGEWPTIATLQSHGTFTTAAAYKQEGKQ